MRVQIDLPDRVWGALALVADERGVKVSELVADAIRAAGKPQQPRRRPKTRRTPSDPDRNPYADREPLRAAKDRELVRDLRERGWSLPEIGKRLGVGGPTIGATLWDMGISTRRATRKETA